METSEAIRTRRSIGKVTAERPSRESIERILEAAVQAPNHHLTEPWRFYVLAGKAREELGQVMAEALKRQLKDPDSETSRALLAKEKEKPLRSPVLIVVASVKSDNPKVVPIEDVEATAAATENLLLEAHNLGLAAQWRTGEPAYNPLVKSHFGLRPEDSIVAFVYLGYAQSAPGQRQRTPAADKTEWRGWD